MNTPPHFRLRHRTDCRICGNQNLTEYLDLGDQPPSNSFIRPEEIATEQRFPLKVSLCHDCGLSQLLDIVASEDIFDDYAYLSSTSKSLCNHYQGLVDEALGLFEHPDNSLMVDIGCNDGIMLKRYPTGRHRLLGIEPSSAGAYAQKAGFDVESEFFTAELGARLAESHGRASIITATNVFAHVDDIASFARGVESFLADDGVFIIEFPYLIDMVEQKYFDTVYHEHLCYLALTPLQKLFSQTGLRAFRVSRGDFGASGPALRLFVCRDGSPRATESSIETMVADEAAWGITNISKYKTFADDVATVRTDILTMIAAVRADGGKIGAFGAPAKGNTLLNYLGLTPDVIVSSAENNDIKIGRVTPGSHIPIVGDDAFLTSGITHALLLTWNYADFFLANSDFIKQGGKFIIPLPEPGIKP